MNGAKWPIWESRLASVAAGFLFIFRDWNEDHQGCEAVRLGWMNMMVGLCLCCGFVVERVAGHDAGCRWLSLTGWC